MSERKIAFAIAALSLALCLAVTLRWDGVNRTAFTGDGFTNSNVLEGGRNFNRLGFIAMRFAPIQRPIAANITDAREISPKVHYTHYPPGPDIIQGLLFSLGLRSDRSHFFAQYLVTVTGIIFCWMTLSLLFKGTPLLIAFSTALLTPSFIFFADSLQSFSWFFFFIWIYVFWILAVFHRKPKSLSRHLLRFVALGAFSSWFSLDTVFPLQAMSLFFLAYPAPWRTRIILLCAAPTGEVLGFLAHILQNAWLLGGVHAAYEDFFDAFRQRTGTMSISELHQTYLVYKPGLHFIKYIISIQWFYTLPVVACAVVGWHRSLAKKMLMHWPVPTGVALLATSIAALAWQLFMRQHSMIHGFTARHGDLFVILGMGLFASSVTQARSRAAQLAPAVVLLLLLAHSALAVADVKFTGPKVALAKALVSADRMPHWVCKQKQRLEYSTDFRDSKAALQQLHGDDCKGMLPTSGLRLGELLAETLFFLR